MQLSELDQFLNIFGGTAPLLFARQLVLKMGFLTMIRKLIPLKWSTGRKEKPIDEEQHP